MNKPWIWVDSIVTNVVDGDTVDAELVRDIGFHGTMTFRQRLRLARIDAWPYDKLHPERTPKGTEAREYVLTSTGNTSCTIVTYKPYAYGDEWMCEIFLPGPSGGADVSLSDLMLTLGHALPYDGRGPRPTKGLT